MMSLDVLVSFHSCRRPRSRVQGCSVCCCVLALAACVGTLNGRTFLPGGTLASWRIPAATWSVSRVPPRFCSLAALAEESEQPKNLNPVLRVGRSTDIRKLAAAIKSRILEFGETTMGCIGKDSVNLAVKGVVMTNKYLVHDGVLTGKKLAVVPSFDEVESPKGSNHTTSTHALMLTVKPLLQSVAEGINIVLPKDATKDPQAAGAIKKAILFAGVAQIHAMGAVKVNRAMKAIRTATLYLRTQEKDDSIEVGAIPYFELLHRNSGEEFSQMVLTTLKTSAGSARGGEQKDDKVLRAVGASIAEAAVAAAA